MDQSNKLLFGSKLANFSPIQHINDLQIIDTRVGSGEAAQSNETITVHYTGALASSGTIFQSSYDFMKPITFQLNQVIQGWGRGIPGMKVGGSRRLLIPTVLAYGNHSPSPDIPANSDLVFDIDLIAIVKP